MSATWGPTTAEGAGAFLDLNGFDQTLSNLQLDGVKRKTIHDTSLSGNSVLTLTAANNALDTNGGNIYIENITITHTGAIADSGVQIDNASLVTLNNATWNAPFYTSVGNSGAGSLVLNSSTFSFGGELLIARNNQNGTVTVNTGSLVTTPNFIRLGDSATGIATLHLIGGTVASKRIYNGSTSTGTLNIDGGTLRATGDNTVDWIEGGVAGVTANVLAGGLTWIPTTST